MKQAFIVKTFHNASLALIERAEEIIDDYREQGLTLTLRQLYYRLVAAGIIPNTLKSYKRLGNLINDARLAGLLDWSMIEDRTRNLKSCLHFESPSEAIQVVRDQYGVDMWEGQPTRVEVWIEKEALSGVVDGVCRELDVPYFACRGYVSQSEQWRAYHRLLNYQLNGQDTVIIHLGDHDPSGIDMTRDNQDRMDLFAQVLHPTIDYVTVDRIALNLDQIRKFNPPPNPAKITDSRAKSYIKRFGGSSWELDALDPKVIIKLVRDKIESFIEPGPWNDRDKKLKRDLRSLDKTIAGLTKKKRARKKAVRKK